MGISGPAQGQGIAREAREVCGWCCPPQAGCAGREPALRRGDDPAATRRASGLWPGRAYVRPQQNRGAVPAENQFTRQTMIPLERTG